MGADGAHIVQVVGQPAALIVSSGALMGAIAAYALSRVLQSQLFGVQILDVVSYAGAFAVVLLAAFLASLTPARAALSVDPVAVLKED